MDGKNGSQVVVVAGGADSPVEREKEKEKEKEKKGVVRGWYSAALSEVGRGEGMRSQGEGTRSLGRGADAV